MHNSNQDYQSAKPAGHVVLRGPALSSHFNKYSHPTMLLFYCSRGVAPNELSLKTMNLATALIPNQQDIFKRNKVVMLDSSEAASLLQSEYTFSTLFAKYPRGFAFQMAQDQSTIQCGCGITNLSVQVNVASQIKLNYYTLTRLTEESKYQVQSRAQQ